MVEPAIAPALRPQGLAIPGFGPSMHIIKKGRAERPGLQVRQHAKGSSAPSFGDFFDQPAFLAALTVLFIVSVTVSLTDSNEFLASEPIASDVFIETPRTSWPFA